MSRWLLGFFLLLPVIALAHIGAPTVVTDGQAGPYRLRVVVRPPDVIPGRAEIDVRFLDGVSADTKVTVLPVSASLGLKGAPTPDVAEIVRGDSALRHGELWLMRSGSYSVHIGVEGSGGDGKFIVPVDAIATRAMKMTRGRGLLLAVLGALLFSGAVTLASSGARQSITLPGAAPSRTQRRKTLIVGVVAAIFFLLTMVWMKRWWDAEDWIYRNRIVYRPRPIEVKSWSENGKTLVRLKILRREADEDSDALTFLPDHGKLMHLFAIREPQLDAFAHLHPIQVSPGVFTETLPNLPPGQYRLYADVTYQDGFATTLSAAVSVPGTEPSAVPSDFDRAIDPDDSWYVANEDAPAAETRVVDANSTVLRAGEPVTLSFKAESKDGSPVTLENYLGMLGHAAVRKADGSVFAHIHPTGTISMAAQDFFENQVAAPSIGKTQSSGEMAGHHHHHSSPGGKTSVVSFPFEFPSAGQYRVWVQFKSDGHVTTGVFDYNILPR